MIRYCCQLHEWDVYELAIDLDHVHLYMSTQPKWSPSEVMRLIKGGTVNKIKEMYSELEEIY